MWMERVGQLPFSLTDDHVITEFLCIFFATTVRT